MQNYNPVQTTDTVANGPGVLNANDQTIMSNSSGTAFPTTNLLVGMKCFRTDLKIEYTLTSTSPVTWAQTLNLNNTNIDSGNFGSYAMPLSGGTFTGGITVPNGTSAITLASGYTIGQGDWGLRNTTPYGYIEFGPANANYAHIYSNLPFYFNQTTLYANGNPILHGGNYTSYAPSLTGSGASGTWGISISGNAATATVASKLNSTNGAGTYNYSPGQGGQPSWLWGSNDGANFYVWNPSNFSVAYATSAGSASSATNASNVPWSGVSSKPSLVLSNVKFVQQAAGWGRYAGLQTGGNCGNLVKNCNDYLNLDTGSGMDFYYYSYNCVNCNCCCCC
jgi:hypothetical protein